MRLTDSKSVLSHSLEGLAEVIGRLAAELPPASRMERVGLCDTESVRSQWQEAGYDLSWRSTSQGSTFFDSALGLDIEGILYAIAM